MNQLGAKRVCTMFGSSSLLMIRKFSSCCFFYFPGPLPHSTFSSMNDELARLLTCTQEWHQSETFRRKKWIARDLKVFLSNAPSSERATTVSVKFACVASARSLFNHYHRFITLSIISFPPRKFNWIFSIHFRSRVNIEECGGNFIPFFLPCMKTFSMMNSQ